MITINLANDENDDWLKKANPNYRKSEAKAHAGAKKLHEQQVAGKKELEDGYAVQLPEFASDPWPDYSTVVLLAEWVALGHGTWEQAIARFKAENHIENGKWVANAEPVS